MAYYLSMDGVDDYLTTPSLTYDEIILDFSCNPTGYYKTYFDTSAGNLSFYRDEGYELWTYEATVNYNGAPPVLSNGLFTLPNDTRGIFSVKKTSGTGTIIVFANSGGGDCMRGILYRVTAKLAGVVVADYNMTTGNVNDVSGNGKHATLTGGTWVNDTPSGTNYPVNLSDSITISETFRKTASKSYLDALTMSESFSKKKIVVIVDSIALSDNESDKANRNYSDTLTLSDSMFSTRGKAVNLSDSITITDTIRKAVGQLKADSVSLSDSDSQSIIKAFNDSLTLSDSITYTKGKAVFLSDSLNVTDSLKKAVSKLQSDTVSLSDTASKRINVTVKLYDIALVSDSIQFSLPNAPSIVRVVEIVGGIQAVVELKGEIIIKSSLPPISLEGDVRPPTELKGEI